MIPHFASVEYPPFISCASDAPMCRFVLSYYLQALCIGRIPGTTAKAAVDERRCDIATARRDPNEGALARAWEESVVEVC